eukprot:scaffold1517_cov397-Prasinococcus_capsulatus_cf.AAC.14
MDVYFLLRSDLVRMGLGRFSCPDTLSSGVHALLLASQLCTEISLFGFSYEQIQLQTFSGHYNRKKAMYQGHSWEFDVLLIRFFHLIGVSGICTRQQGDDSLDEVASID